MNKKIIAGIETLAKNNTSIERSTSLLEKKVIEEVGEFLQAYMKRDEEFGHFLEELSDVILVLNQVYFNLNDESKKLIEETILFKINRTIEREKYD